MLKTKTKRLQKEPFTKKVTIYLDDAIEPKASLLYFHGGGLLCGRREDLPSIHLETLTRAGYQIFAFDYPLAPAASVERILEDVLESITYYQSVCDLPYVLWGRSSGAYLCLLSAFRLTKESRQPAAVLSYYGYGHLTAGWYDSPSPYYRNFPEVPASVLDALPGNLQAKGNTAAHYNTYVYARQSGKWVSLFSSVSEDEFLTRYSLRFRESFPYPLFCAHCTGDKDIPYEEFLALCRKYQPTQYTAIADTHEFDNDETSPSTKELLQETIAFLDSVFCE